jgi:hypothetical protein
MMLAIGGVGVGLAACGAEETETPWGPTAPPSTPTDTHTPTSTETTTPTDTPIPTESSTANLGFLFQDPSGNPYSIDDCDPFRVPSSGFEDPGYLASEGVEHYGVDFAAGFSQLRGTESPPVRMTGIFRHVYPVIDGDVVAMNGIQGRAYLNFVHGISLVTKTPWEQLPEVSKRYLRSQTNGEGADLFTLYGHFRDESLSVMPVVGASVNASQTLLGYQGATQTIFDHVHLEMRYLPETSSRHGSPTPFPEGSFGNSDRANPTQQQRDDWDAWWGEGGIGEEFRPVDPLRVLGKKK